MSDHIADLESNYRFNTLKKSVSIFKLISVINETISKSITYGNKLYFLHNNKVIAF